MTKDSGSEGELSTEAISREVLDVLRRCVAAATLAEMIEIMCCAARDLIGETSEVVLFQMEHGMPVSVEWPQSARRDELEFRRLRCDTLPVLPLDCDRAPHPVTWWRPGLTSSALGQEEHSPGWSAGIELIDYWRGTRYLVMVNRLENAPAFGTRDGTVLQVLSVLYSRIFTLRSLTDARTRRRLTCTVRHDVAEILHGQSLALRTRIEQN